ncbi:hypothetical protein VTJ04DRAFT_4623 [Mycothermus thermophilus]|uniref:uncharacterized protein n=1 Tax=Humicola insolens TaxID=85995 RepID=UPI0037422ED4
MWFDVGLKEGEEGPAGGEILEVRKDGGGGGRAEEHRAAKRRPDGSTVMYNGGSRTFLFGEDSIEEWDRSIGGLFRKGVETKFKKDVQVGRHGNTTAAVDQ